MAVIVFFFCFALIVLVHMNHSDMNRRFNKQMDFMEEICETISALKSRVEILEKKLNDERNK